MLLEKCSYITKEKKMPKYITDNVETSSDDSDESNEEQIKMGFFMLVKYQLLNTLHNKIYDIPYL